MPRFNSRQLFEKKLVQRSNIWRKPAGVDRMGQPLTGGYTRIASNRPCRVSQARQGVGLGGERSNERQRDTVQEDFMLFYKHSEDVRETDRIEVPFVVDGMCEVRLVRPFWDGQGNVHHKEVIVKLLRDST